MPSEASMHGLTDEALERGHESRNPPVSGIFFAAGLVVLMIAGSLLVVWWVMGAWTKTRSLDPSVRVRGTIVAPSVEPLTRFASPHLQLSPHADLVVLRAREDAELTNYGWINRPAGVVRLPIDRAMDLLLQRGLPTRPTNAVAHTAKSEFGLARERSQSR